MNHQKSTLLFIATFLFFLCGHSQNLVINPGAELDPATNGWTIAKPGTACFGGSNWRMPHNQGGYPVAKSGSWFFNSGCGSVSAEIYQDVDVSAYAAAIDATTQAFSFSAWMQSYNQNPPDQGRIVVTYLDAASVVLATYDTGPQANLSVWTEYTSFIVAPIGTRTVRITLYSIARNGSAVDAYFDDISLTPVTVLPVSLVKFTTTLDKNQVLANWQTATESNTASFELQKSENGRNWSTVSITPAAGKSDELKSYQAVDPNPLPGISYYRVVTIDRDGKMSYSKINSVKTSDRALNLKVYPNPASNIMTVEGDAAMISSIRIFNYLGADVTQNIRSATQSTNRVQFEIGSLPAGTYFLKAGDVSTTFQKR